MRLLVTGGAGFMGSGFIRYWIEHHPQDEVINLDALTYAGNLHNLKSVAAHPYYRFIQGSICDAEMVQRAMEGVDWVVHFAAESHVDRSIANPRIFLETNVIGTQILLEAALKEGVKRFHQVSTDEAFGALQLEDTRRFTENSRYDPRSPYSASKAGADLLAKAYYHTYGLPVTITNSVNNFGPYQLPEKIIPLFITNLLENKPVPVYGDGLYMREWIYVDDHSRAVEATLLSGKAGESYCLGGSAELSNLDLARKILKLLEKGEDMITHVKDRLGHDRRYAIDDTKIQTELGWKPLYSFDDALAKTVHWYDENQWWWKPLKESGKLK